MSINVILTEAVALTFYSAQYIFAAQISLYTSMNSEQNLQMF